jgi:hypothetical protein
MTQRGVKAECRALPHHLDARVGFFGWRMIRVFVSCEGPGFVRGVATTVRLFLVFFRRAAGAPSASRRREGRGIDPPSPSPFSRRAFRRKLIATQISNIGAND